MSTPTIPISSSCPCKRREAPSSRQMSRASTRFAANTEDVDGRDKPGHDVVGKRRAVRLAGIAFAVVSSVTIAIGAWVISLGPLAQAREVSTTIVDRNGKLLRAYAMADGRWRLPIDARTGVDAGYLELLL